MRRWMKACCASVVFAVAFFFSSPGLAGENVVFDNDDIDWSASPFPPIGPTGTASGKSTSITGNTVTVKDISDAPSSTFGWNNVHIYGALNENDSDAVTGNTLTVENSDMYPGDTLATPGGVSIAGGGAGGEWYGPHEHEYTISATTNDNTLVVRGSSAAYVTGGEADQFFSGFTHDPDNTAYAITSTLTANGNRVEMNSDSMAYYVYGGDANFGISYHPSSTLYGDDNFTVNAAQTASNNTVAINGGNIAQIVGGNAETDIYHTSTEQGFINGSLSATANDNTVTIENGTVTTKIMGGDAFLRAYGFKDIDIAASATANGNQVEITNSSVADSIRGGSAEYSFSDGNSRTIAVGASNNRVVSKNTNVGASITGGYAGFTMADKVTADADASRNYVEFDGGTVEDIWGGYATSLRSEHSTASENIVLFKDGTATGRIVGAEVSISGPSLNRTFAAVYDNRVTIERGTVAGVAGGFVEGYNGDSLAIGNYVTINGGAVEVEDDQVFGGYAVANYISSGDYIASANGNVITINGGTVTVKNVDDGDPLLEDTALIGGIAEIDSGGTSEARENEVVITNGTVKVDGYGIAGGAAMSDAELGVSIAKNNRSLLKPYFSKSWL